MVFQIFETSLQHYGGHSCKEEKKELSITAVIARMIVIFLKASLGRGVQKKRRQTRLKNPHDDIQYPAVKSDRPLFLAA